MEYTVQKLEYAVSVFYNGEPEERAKAHTWLTAAQRVPEAWNFVWDLLQPTKGTEIQFYAATTLHTKILRCWNELPPESYEELKNKILQYVIMYSNGPKLVTNRLCISLAAFILQQGSVDLVSILRPLSSAANSALLLEVLTVIPEEYNSMTMGTELRIKNHTALLEACPMVIDDMLKLFLSVNSDFSNGPPSEDLITTWTNAANCVSSWLSLDDENYMRTVHTQREPILRALQTTVHVLYNSNQGVVCGSALEACEACLSAIRVALTHGDSARLENEGLTAIADLASLVGPILAAHNVPDSINEELLCAMITCCMAVGETHSSSLVRDLELKGEASGCHLFLKLLLDAQKAPGFYPLHETRSSLMFVFWNSLQDQLMLDSDGTRKLHPIWREVFTQLLLAFITKSEMPPQSELSQEDQELLRRYRQDINDAVMYCFTTLGDVCWDIFASAYEEAQTESRREAVLHILCSLADVAPESSIPFHLPRLLRLALGLVVETQDKRVLETALECLGSYAGWINSMDSNSEVKVSEALGTECMRAAGSALGRAPVAGALALRRLAFGCPNSAAALVQDLVQAVLNAEGVSNAWVRRQLTMAAGAGLVACAHDAAVPLLQTLAMHLATQITYQAPEGSAVSAECAAALMDALNSKTALAAQLLTDLSPCLGLLTRHPALLDALFQILNNALSALMDDCIPFMELISQLTMASFNLQPSSSGVEFVRLAVLMVKEETNELKSMFCHCVSVTVRDMAPDANVAPKNIRPDLVQSLFNMLIAITKKKQQLLDWLTEISDLIRLACRSIRLWELHASTAACRWLGALALTRPQRLKDFGPQLTQATLYCIGGATPRYQVEPIAYLVQCLNNASWGSDVFAAWLRAALAPHGFPTAYATPAHKDKFIDSILRNKRNKCRLAQTVQEFALVCRGLVGTEYARQTIASQQLVA